MNKEFVKKKIKQYSYISLGVIVMAIGFYFFLSPVALCTGGVMGLSIIFEPLYSRLSWFTPSIFIYFVDIVCLIVGGLLLGKEFFIKTIYASLLSPTVVFILERTCDQYFFLRTISDFDVSNPGTSTYIVCTVVSILLIGFGIGIAIKNHGSTGGMDVIQKILSKYLHIPLSKTMYLTDWVLVIIAGFSFFGTNTFGYNIERVLFGSLAVIGTGYVTDLIALNAKNRRTAYIITTMPTAVRDVIYTNLDRGVTFTDCVGAYTGQGKTMVICTLDKNEAYILKDLILEVDPNAFSFITSCKEVVGEYVAKRKIIW